MCVTSRLAHGWQSQSPGLSLDALHTLTLLLSLPHSAQRRSSGHCGAKGRERVSSRLGESAAGAETDRVRPNHLMCWGWEMGVRYLALSARLAKPVARFELGRTPRADFAFVLAALGAPSIVGTLRREVGRTRQIENGRFNRRRRDGPSQIESSHVLGVGDGRALPRA